MKKKWDFGPFLHHFIVISCVLVGLWPIFRGAQKTSEIPVQSGCKVVEYKSTCSYSLGQNYLNSVCEVPLLRSPSEIIREYKEMPHGETSGEAKITSAQSILSAFSVEKLGHGNFCLGITYSGVATAFSDSKGSHSDKLQSGDCAVGRRNVAKMAQDDEGSWYSIDLGVTVYKYGYIPYGSRLKIEFENGEVREFTVKDDCGKTNEDQIEYVRNNNGRSISWKDVRIWVDIWKPNDAEASKFGIQEVKITILKWGEWDPKDK